MLLGADSDTHPLGGDIQQVPSDHKAWLTQQKAARVLGHHRTAPVGFRWQDRYGTGNMSVAIADLLQDPEDDAPVRGSGGGMLKRLKNSAKELFSGRRA